MAATERVSIGFKGGPVLGLKVAKDDLDRLRGALSGGGERWHELNTEDGAVQLDLAEVAYVRVESDEHRVGFG